jgi:hypothetical protein
LRFKEYSHRHGKELLQLIRPGLYSEITETLSGLRPFPHGSEKGKTVKSRLVPALRDQGWSTEKAVSLSEGKEDFVDLYKDKVAVEMEWSRFEMFFRDFFRFMLLYERNEIEVGITLTLDDMAYERWGDGSPSYRAARANLGRLVDFLKGDYHTVVRVPIWCIGIE